ncbi:MAG TPA: YjfB family protein [Pseudogracilibacillus sp.]|nr:YjfB family protein [Pseudogracilibacillus sp.]
MDIAALSMAMKQQQLQTNASMAIMDKSKQVAEQDGEQLINMLEQSMPAHPTLGRSVDISL